MAQNPPSPSAASNLGFDFIKWWRFAHVRQKHQAVLAWNRITYFKMLHRQAYYDAWNEISLETRVILAIEKVAPDLPLGIVASLHSLNLPLYHHPKMPREILKVLEDYSGPDLLPDKSVPGAQLIQRNFRDLL